MASKGNLFSDKELLDILDRAVNRAVEEKIKPKVKKIIQKHIDEEVVSKDFVDKKNRYRKYYYTVNGKKMTGVAGHASKAERNHKDKNGNNDPITVNTLGHGRTQTAKYTHMADEKYMETTPFENDQFLAFNTMPPPGHSIFGTNIQNINDPLLYTKWIVEGDIVMPTLKHMDKSEWDRYVKDSDNRYEARPFINNAAKAVEKNMKEFGNDLTQAIQEEIIKSFKNIK